MGLLTTACHDFRCPSRCPSCVYVVFRPAAASPHQFRLYREHFRSGFLILRYCLWHNLDICSIYWMTLFVSLYRRRLEAIVTVEHCIPLALHVTLVAQRRVAYIVELFEPCNLHTQTTCIIICSSASRVLSSIFFRPCCIPWMQHLWTIKMTSAHQQ